MDWDYAKKDAAICSYSACDQPVERQGRQGGAKLFCSNSCRTRAYQERRLVELRQPAEAIRNAAIRAHDALDTWIVYDALEREAVPEDIHRNFVRAREVLEEIAKRIPPTTE